MLKNIRNIFFLGIGGIGMSALARWTHAKDFEVQGWDDNPDTDLVRCLIDEGISVFSGNVNQLEDIFNTWVHNNSILIYTPAISQEHKCFKRFQTARFNIYKRSELLSFVCRNHRVIAIAGTHGKTTISIMLSHILKSSGINCSAFFGGISKNYQSNLLIGDADIIVVEADEYDQSFLQLNPDISLISSLDKDHGDIYASRSSMLVAYKKFMNKTKISIGKTKLDYEFNFNYSISPPADIYADHIHYDGNLLSFKINFPNNKHIKSSLINGTMYNLENAIGASALAYKVGIKIKDIGRALSSFLGVFRRFEYHANSQDFILIDDYAHHPEELKALISSLKLLYKKKEILLIFQPHLFSRTKEFENQFAKVLSLVDKLVLLDIYGAREKLIVGVNSQSLLAKVNIKTKIYCDINNEEGVQKLKKFLLKECPEIVVTAGAGDIYKLIPFIKSLFT